MDTVTQAVLDALHQARDLAEVPVREPELDASIFEELGFTSLQMVDVALCIEEALKLDEFPLQDWLDAQPDLGSAAYTVRSLVWQCEKLLERPTA
jgi:hypothetical protein